jgi:hypothetical protein
MTAPVSGFGSEPTWMARVPKPSTWDLREWPPLTELDESLATVIVMVWSKKGVVGSRGRSNSKGLIYHTRSVMRYGEST